MELFAFFVGGGQTHHREIFFLGRHKKLLQPEKRGVFTYKKQNQKLFCLLKHFTRLSEYFFLNHRGEEEAHVWYFFLSSKSLLVG